MELSRADRLHIQYAQGFLELGAMEKANDELDIVTPDLRAHPAVLEVRYDIYAAAKKWPMCVEIARHLAKVQPDNPHWPASLAYATRRAASIEAARTILLQAEGRFPAVAIIKYNLGCYAAQLGELEEAKRLVRKAIDMDRSFQKLALDDPDLEPVWESLKQSAPEVPPS